MNKEEILKQISNKKLELKKITNQYMEELEELKQQLVKCQTTRTTNLSLDEKIDLFMDYFKGRDDVYPYLSINKYDSSKKYYIPACENEWKQGVCNKVKGKSCKLCQYRINKPLTRETIKKHLYYNSTIGVYPMLEDETCYFLAFDFDDKKNENHINEDVLAFASTCDKYEIPIGIEKSRSGHGIHVWIFFKDRIKAKIARKMGSLLLSKTMDIRDSLQIDSFDRMFPNQDFMPRGGYGNLIALPFQTEPARYGNSIFIDRNFIPIQYNQFEYLKSINKLTEVEVYEKIKNLSEDTIDISNQNLEIKKEVKNKNKITAKFPNKINVVLDNMICIDKANLSAEVKNIFRRLATFANPEFYKRQAMRMSVYNIPMVIDCSKEDEQYLKLPRGTLEYLEDLCKTHSVKIIKKDKRYKGKKLDIHFNGKLREGQQEALDEILKYDNGILCAPTGFGKTVLGCKLIEQRNVNTLILVNKIQLLNQWKERIKEFLNVDEVGEVSSRRKNTTNVIDVASIKSLWNKGKVLDIARNYGMIIIDECHHTSAYTFEQTINNSTAKYIYGISATPTREDGHTPIIKMQCGDIRYEVDSLKYNKRLNIPMKVIVRHSHLNFTDPQINNYELNEINDLIAKDVIRSEVIINDIKKEYEKGKNILVLTERLEHLNYLYEKLEKDINNTFKYYGGIGKKILKKYQEKKDYIEDKNENKVIISTGSYIGEGFDDSKLDVLFLTMPISGETRLTQYAGRLHRKDKDKKEIIIYDYIDNNFSKTRNMFLKRKKTYEKLGYEVID